MSIAHEFDVQLALNDRHYFQLTVLKCRTLLPSYTNAIDLAYLLTPRAVNRSELKRMVSKTAVFTDALKKHGLRIVESISILVDEEFQVAEKCVNLNQFGIRHTFMQKRVYRFADCRFRSLVHLFSTTVKGTSLQINLKKKRNRNRHSDHSIKLRYCDSDQI